MASKFGAGDAVQTPLGKGVVREARRNGRLLVDVSGRSIVLDERTVTPLAGRTRSPAKTKAPLPPGRSSGVLPSGPRHAPAEVDLHGLTVEEALARAGQAINDALLADLFELRLIHGRSGGRIRAALHRSLKDISSVRAFRLDPRNDGVTIVTF